MLSYLYRLIKLFFVFIVLSQFQKFSLASPKKWELKISTLDSKITSILGNKKDNDGNEYILIKEKNSISSNYRDGFSLKAAKTIFKSEILPKSKVDFEINNIEKRALKVKLIKVSSSGKLEWNKIIYTENIVEHSCTLSLDKILSNNNILISKNCWGFEQPLDRIHKIIKLDKSGFTLQEYVFPNSVMYNETYSLDKNEDIIFTNVQTIQNSSYPNLKLQKFSNEDGSLLWEKNYKLPKQFGLTKNIYCQDDIYIYFGNWGKEKEFLFYKLNEIGDYQDQLYFKNEDTKISIYDIKSDSVGNFYILGKNKNKKLEKNEVNSLLYRDDSFNEETEHFYDTFLFITKYDKNFNELWTHKEQSDTERYFKNPKLNILAENIVLLSFFHEVKMNLDFMNKNLKNKFFRVKLDINGSVFSKDVVTMNDLWLDSTFDHKIGKLSRLDFESKIRPVFFPVLNNYDFGYSAANEAIIKIERKFKTY